MRWPPGSTSASRQALAGDTLETDRRTGRRIRWHDHGHALKAHGSPKAMSASGRWYCSPRRRLRRNIVGKYVEIERAA
jgi:hypothetical protein